MKTLNMLAPTPESERDESGRKQLNWMLADSAIIGCIAIFATIGGSPPTWETAWIAFKAFGLAFFIQLAVERGLKRPQKDAD